MNLSIEIVKLSDERHRLTVRRSDGTEEGAELETRSFLLHDLVHYAVEAESGIDDGFWGLLARGVSMEALSDHTMEKPLGPGIALAERLVGPFQSLWNGRLERALYFEHALGVATFVDDAWLDRVGERLRRLTGAWRAVPVSHALALPWPPTSDPLVVTARSAEAILTVGTR